MSSQIYGGYKCCTTLLSDRDRLARTILCEHDFSKVMQEAFGLLPFLLCKVTHSARFSLCTRQPLPVQSTNCAISRASAIPYTTKPFSLLPPHFFQPFPFQLPCFSCSFLEPRPLQLFNLSFSILSKITRIIIQLFQSRLSTSKAEKSNTSAKGCWEPL